MAYFFFLLETFGRVTPQTEQALAVRLGKPSVGPDLLAPRVEVPWESQLHVGGVAENFGPAGEPGPQKSRTRTTKMANPDTLLEWGTGY